jgi:hypothetical protein
MPCVPRGKSQDKIWTAQLFPTKLIKPWSGVGTCKCNLKEVEKELSSLIGKNVGVREEME